LITVKSNCLLSQPYCVTVVLTRPQNRVDLSRSIWCKYRSTRSINSSFGHSHESARLRATVIDSINFILDSSVYA